MGIHAAGLNSYPWGTRRFLNVGQFFGGNSSLYFSDVLRKSELGFAPSLGQVVRGIATVQPPRTFASQELPAGFAATLKATEFDVLKQLPRWQRSFSGIRAVNDGALAGLGMTRIGDRFRLDIPLSVRAPKLSATALHGLASLDSKAIRLASAVDWPTVSGMGAIDRRALAALEGYRLRDNAFAGIRAHLDPLPRFDGAGVLTMRDLTRTLERQWASSIPTTQKPWAHFDHLISSPPSTLPRVGEVVEALERLPAEATATPTESAESASRHSHAGGDEDDVRSLGLPWQRDLASSTLAWVREQPGHWVVDLTSVWPHISQHERRALKRELVAVLSANGVFLSSWVTGNLVGIVFGLAGLWAAWDALMAHITELKDGRS